MAGNKISDSLLVTFLNTGMSKFIATIILLAYSSAALANGPAGEIFGSFLILLLLHIAGVCLMIIIGLRFSILIHIVVTSVVIPLYIIGFLWVSNFLASNGLLGPDTIQSIIIYYVSFYFFTLIVPFIISYSLCKSCIKKDRDLSIGKQSTHI